MEAMARHHLLALSINYLASHYRYYILQHSRWRVKHLPTRRSKFLDFGARSVFYNRSSLIVRIFIQSITLSRYNVITYIYRVITWLNKSKEEICFRNRMERLHRFLMAGSSALIPPCLEDCQQRPRLSKLRKSPTFRLTATPRASIRLTPRSMRSFGYQFTFAKLQLVLHFTP